jgi:hypothetical protein
LIVPILVDGARYGWQKSRSFSFNSLDETERDEVTIKSLAVSGSVNLQRHFIGLQINALIPLIPLGQSRGTLKPVSVSGFAGGSLAAMMFERILKRVHRRRKNGVSESVKNF